MKGGFKEQQGTEREEQMSNKEEKEGNLDNTTGGAAGRKKLPHSPVSPLANVHMQIRHQLKASYSSWFHMTVTDVNLQMFLSVESF